MIFNSYNLLYDVNYVVKVDCVFPIVSMLLQAEFGHNDRREDTPHFTVDKQKLSQFWYIHIRLDFDYVGRSFSISSHRYRLGQ